MSEDSSSSSSSQDEIQEQPVPLAKPDHVALYISPLNGAGKAVKFLVSPQTSYKTLLDVVRSKFKIKPELEIDIAVLNSIENDALIGYLSESIVTPMQTHKGMLDEGLQFSYQVREATHDDTSHNDEDEEEKNDTPVAVPDAKSEANSSEDNAKTNASIIETPKHNKSQSKEASPAQSPRKSTKNRLGKAGKSAVDAFKKKGVKKRRSTKGEKAAAIARQALAGNDDLDDEEEDTGGSGAATPLTSNGAEKKDQPDTQLITVFIANKHNERPTPHIIEAISTQTTAAVVQYLYMTKRLDKKRFDSSWLYEVDDSAGLDRRLADDECVLDLVRQWDENESFANRKLWCRDDKPKTKKARTVFRQLAGRLTTRRGDSHDEHHHDEMSPSLQRRASAERRLSHGPSPSQSPADSPVSLTASGINASSRSITSPAANTLRARWRKAEDDADSPGAVIDMLRKELETANAQVETLELALAVANNKLVRVEHKHRSKNDTTAGSISIEALARAGAAARFAPPSSLLLPSDVAAASAAAMHDAVLNEEERLQHEALETPVSPRGDSNTTTRLEIALNVPELGLDRLLIEHFASSSDVVKDIVHAVLSRYGLEDTTQFGLKGAGERWFDDKVVVAQSHSITKHRLAIERRKGRPKKMAEDLHTRVTILQELLGRTPLPAEIELVVARAGDGPASFAGLALRFHVIDRLCGELERRGFDSLGLFRVSGEHNRVRALWATFAGDADLPLDNEAINDIAGALKLYVRSSQPPLLPGVCVEALVNAQRRLATASANQKESEEKVKTNIGAPNTSFQRATSVKDIVQSLDAEENFKTTSDLTLLDIRHALFHALSAHDFAVLARLMRMLVLIEKHSETNKMTLSNLGVVFGPALIRSDNDSLATMRDAAKYGNAAVCTLIERYDDIFEPLLTQAGLVDASTLSKAAVNKAVAVEKAEKRLSRPVDDILAVVHKVKPDDAVDEDATKNGEQSHASTDGANATEEQEQTETSATNDDDDSNNDDSNDDDDDDDNESDESEQANNSESDDDQGDVVGANDDAETSAVGSTHSSNDTEER